MSFTRWPPLLPTAATATQCPPPARTTASFTISPPVPRLPCPAPKAARTVRLQIPPISSACSQVTQRRRLRPGHRPRQRERQQSGHAMEHLRRPFKATKFSSFTLGPPATITHGQPMPCRRRRRPSDRHRNSLRNDALIANTGSSASNQQAARQLFTLTNGSLPAGLHNHFSARRRQLLPSPRTIPATPLRPQRLLSFRRHRQPRTQQNGRHRYLQPHHRRRGEFERHLFHLRQLLCPALHGYQCRAELVAPQLR